MTTLAESFLADLEELEEDEPEDKDEDMPELEGIEPMIIPDSVRQLARLNDTERYKRIVKEALEFLIRMDIDNENENSLPGEDPMHKFLVECNQLVVDIDNEIVTVHNYIRDKYRTKFPELESLVHHPIDYARIVKKIGNEMNLTSINLDGVLPSATIMVVTVTATTTPGQPLSQEDLDKTIDACDLALSLDDDKQTVLKFIESQMHRIAPNLSELIGTEISARLIGLAGGIQALATIPSCNLRVLGAKKKLLTGYSNSNATIRPHEGYLWNCHIMQTVPYHLRQKAARLISGKASLLARIDAARSERDGYAGKRMREEVINKIEKWQEAPPAKIVKPLPAPDSDPKKRRGGRRLRTMKEKYAQSELRKASNRVGFNQAEEEFIDGDEVIGLGLIGKEGSGRLKLVSKQQKLKLSAKTAKKYKKVSTGNTGTTSGISSSLVFTPVQGMEFVNPKDHKSDLDMKSGTESYFSELGGFRTIIKKE